MKEEQGYKILLDIVFEDDHGFALGCNLMDFCNLAVYGK